MPFPDICVEDRESCPNEWRTLRYSQSTCGSQQFQVRDRDGLPIDLTDRDVVLLMRQHIDNSQLYLGIFGTVDDASDGIVTITMAEEDSHGAGLYIGEISVQRKQITDSSSSAACDVFHRLPCYVEITENLEVANVARYRTMSIAEIRLAIRDKCSEDNFLLDNIEFTDTEIAWAITRPIDYWNEALPPLGQKHTYSTSTFPFRYNWLSGAVGELLLLAAHHYRRNNFRYQAGGVSVDDKAGADTYEATGRDMIQQYRGWVATQKRSINVGQAYASTSIDAYG